jgi:hypothetical protein
VNNFKDPEEYERLAQQCDRAGRCSQLTSEREFYARQAALFRRLAEAKRKRVDLVPAG